VLVYFINIRLTNSYY